MLGERIAEDRGRITDVRALPAGGAASRLEVSFQARGTILGVGYTELGTYESWPAEAGTLRGKGQGVMMTEDGDTVFWTGEGAGKPTGKGLSARWRGAVFYQTASPRLARLNGIAAVFEREVDAAGQTNTRAFEWK